MEGNRVRKVLASFAAAALVASAATANAQVTSADAGCRSAIAKNAGKLGATTNKTINSCIKSVLLAKIPVTTNCNSWAIADTPGGKIGLGIGKLQAGVPVKCLALPANIVAGTTQCPSPADGADAGGSTNAVDTVTELSNCQVDINTDGLEPMRKYILNPQFARIIAHPNAKNIAKCANGIAKGAAKLWQTVNKERAKCQTTSDKVPGPYAYGCSTYDALAKIAGAQTKLNDGVQKSCGDTLLTGTELGLVGSCDSTVAGIKTCVANAVKKNAGGATATAFEFAGVCPVEVKVGVNGGTGGGQTLNRTQLDAGFTGLGHDADVVDGFVSRVNLACNADCSNCTVTSNCEEGNCRCSNDPSILCTTPFVTGGPCGANTCVVYFGPPLALAAGGVATCVTNVIATELVGTADAGTGESNTLVKNTAKVHLGISQVKPCPTCTGLTIGAGGTCSGGQRNGLACTTDAINAAFGNVSYDCPPTTAANVTGAGLKIDLNLTDGAVAMPFGDACEVPNNTFDCACGACTLDPATACQNDAECSGAGLGTCGQAGGAPRAPNGCTNLTCVADATGGAGEGTCGSGTPGPQDTFCSGAVKGSGEGYIPCSSNGDCTAPLGGGTCTLSKQRDCYLDPITVSGTNGTDGAELVSLFCSGPTTNGGVNAAGGIPGAGRVRLDFDFTGYCPDGTTEFELGGSNCP